VSKNISWELRGNLRIQTQVWVFLLSKLVYEGKDSLSEREILALFLLKDKLSTVKDKGWVEKYFNWFEQTERIFSYFTQYLKRRDIFPWCQRVIEDPFFKGSLLSACAFFGRRTHFNVKCVLRKINRSLKKNPRPQRRIGVGYRDHGTARDVALDGSPSWQEVAAAHLKSRSTDPTVIEAYRTYLWKIQGRRLPYYLFTIDSL
jgi:hypothetical protein